MKNNQLGNSEQECGLDPMRRLILSALGGTAAVLASPPLFAKSAKSSEPSKGNSEKIFTGYDRKRSFNNNELDGTPWVASQIGNFDLDDPAQNNLAKIKMTNNLVGKRTYVPMLVRLSLGRDQEPGGRLLGAAAMFTWQLQIPDPSEFPNVPKGTALMRSMYTARYLDPHTMEPVKELKNPYNGKMMLLEDSLFVENFLAFPNGGSHFIEEPQFANDAAEKAIPSLFKKWGDDLVVFMGGVYSEPGKHQPRMTENMWAASYKDVMDPSVSVVRTSYNFMSIKKAFEKPWTGYAFSDEDLLLSLAYGKKVHSLEDIPDFHKRVVAEKYPDRL